MKGRVSALDSVTLTIHSGEHTAIVGPNGSGKTTLINLLTRDEWAVARPGATPPVRVFGSARWNVFDLRTRLGIVSADLHQKFADGNSAGAISGEDAVVSGFFGTRGVLRYVSVTEAQRRRAREALERVEAAHLASKRLDRMSTGEARRVLIARALVTDPQALVLDEPSTGLDVVARHRFLESLARIADAGTTVVLVTHHVEEIIPAIERVVLLDRGRIAAVGAKPSVLTAARLSAVYGASIELRQRDGYYYTEPLPARGVR